MASRKSSAKPPKILAGLWFHPTDGYAKKCNGKTWYFGKDPVAAAEQFAKEWPVIAAGGVPDVDGITLVDLCEQFITDRDAKLQAGDLSPRSFADYKRTCDSMLAALGRAGLVSNLRPADFAKLRSALAKTRGPVALKNEIGRCKVVFNFAYKNFLIEQPVRYGTQFDAADCFFVTKYGGDWAGSHDNVIAHEFRKVLDATGL